jgi:HlyD family secretion protein
MSADQVTNFDVKIRMLKDSYAELLKGKEDQYSPFRPGMSATVDIHTTRADQVISVPIQAVTTRSDTTEKKSRSARKESVDEEKEKKECVFVVEENKAKIIYVKTGIQNTMHIEILEGLDTSHTVIIAPYSAVSRKLKNDQMVEIVSEEELFSNKKE